MTKDEALRMALEAMEYADACLKKQLTTKTKHEYAQDLLLEAGAAIREVLAQPEQEPVAWRWENGGEDKWLNKYIYLDNGGPDCPEDCEPLYTSTPASKPWVGLSNDEIYDMYNEPRSDAEMVEFARAIEAKLREKNAPQQSKEDA